MSAPTDLTAELGPEAVKRLGRLEGAAWGARLAAVLPDLLEGLALALPDVDPVALARDLVGAATVTSAYRKPRYVIEKVADGISSDWRWYTELGATLRRGLSPAAFARRQRERIVALAFGPGLTLYATLLEHTA